MLTIHPQYITDDKGEKLSAVIPIQEFKTLMDELDELEDIKLYDSAKADNEQSIPIEEAFKLIEVNRDSDDK